MAAAKQAKLFDQMSTESTGYSAKDIEVLEGLEPVRKRPGMYIGGTDERAYHHLFAEVLDNSMDEAVAGHASRIEIKLDADGFLAVSDNGRGIPVDPHPKFPKKSALEVIMTTLHAGGKFSDKAYETAGGLHGVGISVVNALSELVEVEVARDKILYRQTFSRGIPQDKLKKVGTAPNRRGTVVKFKPDFQIFGEKMRFRPARLFQMARSKAYLYRGVEVRWSCDPSLLPEDSKVPAEATLSYPNGLADQLDEVFKDKATITDAAFTGLVDQGGEGKVEWAIAWTRAGFGEADGFSRSYCNTIPTPDGGTHEAGFRSAITKGLRNFGELTGNKKASEITAEDIMGHSGLLLSVFIKGPEFVGQTKDKLSTTAAFRLVENSVRDRFDHWLAGSPKEADKLLGWAVERAEERQRRRKAKDISRKSATKKLRLPGKLADCSNKGPDGTELFLVEGDSAGGSAKQARDRKTQAILPLRGKILNVESASLDKMMNNQEINDLSLALGTALGKKFDMDDLRYDRIIIMTDADVDGAHIASLLITFFYRMTPGLIESGRLFLALPPLYKLSNKGTIVYAMDDADRAEKMKEHFKPNQKVDMTRFKGLGEMNPSQLKETTMNPATRTLARVTLEAIDDVEVPAEELINTLMGKKAELRFRFIQENAAFVEELDI
ncbi:MULTISPECIES: DNA topoisomerase IV subunit B [unclassified Hyphomonas]|jgi:topoisomerase-4 subunit B|uniref:DNA topoisomerase 2 n=4 Tax=root TaxID=1 RepID=A0A1Y5I5A7_OSTTA|nr:MULTISPECIES: DNA topoisomerase IV subunit B [unclassified Hyphomonas]MAN91510.1 DNA topoisomerase IV subunit B [Hyphomonadaceae bacterium]OUS44631.1 DNA topoisomerase IV, B subunit [Ostreococcus tauri]QSR21367.1 DNA topoisomerase IV subunit B [Hyphomonas sp. KY3]MAA82956.1 DNA topoisomerase IV subunit B [Hyphomonas sp.]MAL43008.1 DNA topoisomerase IV subunit B [Hyphomonas sp.]|tara:strand:+ start:101 stop:2098 length:1998 start_codon:yes stop_codon:yes gene_type:complete